MAKPIENILIFPLESKMDRTRHRVTSNSYIRFRDSYVEYETRAIFINFSLKNFSKLQNSYLAIVFRYRQTSSNVVKRRQTLSNIVKHYTYEILFKKKRRFVVKHPETSSNITLTDSFWEEEKLCQTSWNIVKRRQTLYLRDSFWEEETLSRQTSWNITLARSFFEKKRSFIKHRETSSKITLTRFFFEKKRRFVKHRETSSNVTLARSLFEKKRRL